jgi:hypothetical protein
MEVSGELHAPAASSLVPIAQKAAWALMWLTQSREKSLGPAGSRTLVVQPVA